MPTSNPAIHFRLRNIPLGTQIHNIELRIGKGGQIVRSAGTYAQLMAKEEPYALIKLAFRRSAHGSDEMQSDHRAVGQRYA